MTCDSSIAVPIISAVSALAGVAISQIFVAIQAERERSYQRRILLREKYEELAQRLADALEDYLKLLTSNTNHELLTHSRPVHALRVSILARLYFAELKEPALDFLSSVVSFQNALASNYNPQSQQGVGVQGVASKDVAAAQKQLELAKTSLEEAIDNHANTYATA